MGLIILVVFICKIDEKGEVFWYEFEDIFMRGENWFEGKVEL